jgi:hypothetical protein
MEAVVDGMHLLTKAELRSFATREEAQDAFEKGKEACLVKIVDE